MPLLVEPDASWAAELKAALGQDSQVVPHLEAARTVLADAPDLDVVVLGPSIDSAGAFRLASEFRIPRPTLGIVLVRRRIETSLLADALRNGVRDVVEARDLPGLDKAVRRARVFAADLRRAGQAEGSESDRRRGKVVTVFSAKGGCGKTTVSTNLAALMATMDHRRICLVDLDLAFGDVGISLQLEPQRSIADAVAMGESLDADGLRGLLTPHPTGVQTLTAPVGPESKDSIKPELVIRIIDLLADEFDYVVVDTPPAFDDTTLAAFDRTDLLVMLTTLDVPAIKNLKLSMETLDLIGFPPERVRVVVNRADAKVGLGVDDVQKSVRHPIAARIPSSRDVPAATNRGVALTVDQPAHPVSIAIRSIAEDDAIAPTSTDETARSGSALRPSHARRAWFRSRRDNR